MRVVADTNTIISALLWRGPARRLLDLARMGELELFTSTALLIELADVLGREKFLHRLKQADVTARELSHGFAALATRIEPATIMPTVLADADDDAVLACAVAAQAEAIASGDNHLLALGYYQQIPIWRVSVLVARFPQSYSE
jgi:putative PIN family toxin of toxin-antitoxin system